MTTYWECSEYDGDDELALQCPKCGCPKLVLEETEGLSDGEAYRAPKDRLGEKAACFECGHEFTITENCWKKTIL
jgi:hypothetical protein